MMAKMLVGVLCEALLLRLAAARECTGSSARLEKDALVIKLDFCIGGILISDQLSILATNLTLINNSASRRLFKRANPRLL